MSPSFEAPMPYQNELIYTVTTPRWTGQLFGFHAHVYFSPADVEDARLLQQKALWDFRAEPLRVMPLTEKAHGPHPLPSFELRLPPMLLQEVVLWLMENRRHFPVLVHQVTGDDPKDHFQGAFWMGEILPLDKSRLDPPPQRNL